MLRSLERITVLIPGAPSEIAITGLSAVWSKTKQESSGQCHLLFFFLSSQRNLQISDLTVSMGNPWRQKYILFRTQGHSSGNEYHFFSNEPLRHVSDDVNFFALELQHALAQEIGNGDQR